MKQIEKSEKVIEEIKKLSETIVNYSLEVKENDKVLITTETEEPNSLVIELIKDIVKNKGVPYVKIINPEIETLLLELTKENRIDLLKNYSKFDVDNYDCFISIKYSTNDFENNNIKNDIRKKISKSKEKYDNIRINKRRWVLLNYPSKLDSYKAKMKTEDYKNFSFSAMNIDYNKMYEDLKPLKELMEKTDKVRIKAPNTDITFSISKMPIIPCCGKCNIPDGEIYTAPIKDSVNGVITYNTSSPYQGYVFENIKFKFKNGKIVEATSKENSEKLNEILNTDEGARYIGEFAIGLNPVIKHPMKDILYDEKIIGSIHFTPGRAYEDSDNGNKSLIHWDLVLIERKEYGGGELYFDDKLIRKDGKFVIDELKHLNYEK